MNFKTTFTLLLVVVPIICFTQTNNLSLEYSPHLSNITNIDSTDTSFKISHDVSFKYDHFISDNIGLIGKLGFTNFGYRIKGKETLNDTTSTVILTSNKRDRVLNFNYLMLNTGLTFKYKQYFIAPEIGMGFLISTSSKYVGEDSIGNTAPTSRISGKGKLKFRAIPISLSIARKIEMINIVPIIGVKAYYTKLRRGSGMDGESSMYGVGLLLGIDF